MLPIYASVSLEEELGKRDSAECLMAFPGYIDIQCQSPAMYLVIGVFARIVLVLIVSLKLNVFSKGEERARIDFGRTHLLILAFVVNFSTS